MNRLKIMRKVRKMTQKQVADLVGVTQNAYCYWELEKVRVDATAYQKLASFYGVSTDFLMGVRFQIAFSVDKWPKDLQEVYRKASEEEKVYLEYKYGKPVFSDAFSKQETASIEDDLKVALFGNDIEVTDEMWQKVAEYAALIKLQHEHK